MPVYVTGRQRRLENSFTVESDHFGYLTPGIIDPIEGDTEGELSQAYPAITVENYWRDPFNIGKIQITSGISKTAGYLVEAWDGLGGYDSDDTRTIVPGSGTWGYDDHLSGTGTVWIDTEECIELHLMIDLDPDQTDDEGYPALPHIDEYGFRDGWTIAAKDGLLSWYGRVFDRARVGGSAGAEFSGTGAYLTTGVSASVSSVIAAAFEVSHLAVYTNHIHGSSNKGKGYDSVVTLDWHGLSVSPSYTRTQGSSTATINGSSITVDVPGLFDGADHGGTASLLGEGQRTYRIDVSAFNIDGAASTDSYGVFWSAHQLYDSLAAAWRVKPEAFTINPSGFATVTQRSYTCGSYLEFTVQSGVSAAEACPVQAWLDLEGTQEDQRDWRLQMQLPFLSWSDGMTVAQAAATEVAADETITAADQSVAATVGNWEGYRYLRFSATPDFAAKAMTITVGAKEYSFTTGASGSPTVHTIDLTLPVNMPAGLVKDHRDSRFPLEGPATPITEPPKVDETEEDLNGWRFGVLEEVTNIVFSGLAGAETLALTDIELVRDATAEIGVLQSFDDDQRYMKGWDSPTDSTYLTPTLWLYSDGKQVAPWPYRARVVPTAAAAYWVYWTLNSLKTFVEHVPGWTVAFGTPPAYPHLSGAPLSTLFSSGLDAAHLTDVVWDGDSWENQAVIPFAAETLRIPYRLDLVSVPPGCGDMESDYDPDTNYITHLYASKVLRGQAEGFAPAAETVRLEDHTTGADRGTGAAAANLFYRTGTPFGYGNDQHKTRLLLGGEPYEGPWRVQNRYRGRTSFIEALSARAMHMTGAPNGLLWALYATDAGLGVQRFLAWSGVSAFDVVADSNIESGQIAFDPRGRVVVVYDSGGSVKATDSWSWGEEWSEPVVIGSGTEPAVAIDEVSGVQAVSRWASGSHSLWISLDSGATWIDQGAIVAAAEGRAGLEFSADADHALVFCWDDGGTINRLRSRDFGDNWA